ncbi:MAG: hypothetical protein M1833_004435 [Piccolia ochrophora]|nr:MAG: hypothetical protein M1833_004435 [Piccolia ochrophora]
MFQSFTGSSRRPRQVNLSGRTVPGPATHVRSSPSASGPPSSLALAQQERLLRQRERERLESTQRIQRVWRGCRSRKALRATWRGQWDALEVAAGASQRPKEDQLWRQLYLLVHFADWSEGDLERWYRSTVRLLDSGEGDRTFLVEPRWRAPLLKLERLTLAVITLDTVPVHHFEKALAVLTTLTTIIPKDVAQDSTRYYEALSKAIRAGRPSTSRASVSRDLLVSAIRAPLHALTSETLAAYEGFARSLLPTPGLDAALDGLDDLSTGLNFRLLTTALDALLRCYSPELLLGPAGREGILWLLAHFIYLHRHTYETDVSHRSPPESDYVVVVSTLLGAVADDVSKRIDVEDAAMAEPGDGKSTPLAPLPQFVRQQIRSLVNQESVTSLLARTDSLTTNKEADTSKDHPQRRLQIQMLANYALTLLRIFPRRSDEIRMWLYLGSTSTMAATPDNATARLPAIKYFWSASQRTEVFSRIFKVPHAAVDLLRPHHSQRAKLGSRPTISGSDMGGRDSEWRVIFIFLELYSFVLKVTDDDEFFSERTSYAAIGADQALPSWTRESALALKEVETLTIFLKNLAFTMYWNASELVGMNEEGTVDGIRNYFHASLTDTSSLKRETTREAELDSSIAGIPGMTVDHVKGLVTGLLRMLYERDSRRRFLPRDHWLMTGKFDMEGFIPAVVAEEEDRHRVQEADEEDQEDGNEGVGEDTVAFGGIAGTARTQRTLAVEALRKQQRRASRKKYLEAVTPRLEILQNMPFFIPFTTRVQIFREFVFLDQSRRRGGHIDPEHWRLSILQNTMSLRDSDGQPFGASIIGKHHADIRRGSVFDDAFDQFYELGEGLKEPIQISFIDRFGTPEAGIDGGGVTKEFITSVTQEAFSPTSGLRLFVENDQNLLHPNPAAIDERKEFLREAGIAEGSADWNQNVRDLLRRYEFLGRIIGKCLYEGILVDVGFAGFFLLKWALTGGTGSASKESGYRANLNDLRDLDETLYQGLLQLKNYPGNVEDFSLDFTVTDTVRTVNDVASGHVVGTKTITRELKPNGSQIPVTNENRLVYISYMARHRLQAQPYLQTNAFLRGLGDMIQPSWLSMFNQAELQTLVGGASSQIDVADLRRNTSYGGLYVIGDDQLEHPAVKLFWEVMTSLSDTERRMVLKFVTSTPRSPLLGFGQLNPRFSIRDAGTDQDRLPSTSTCVNLLKLPRYTNASQLREKLLYAVNSGAGFDLS